MKEGIRNEMKYIFSNQVIDFAMLFLMIWNLWIFIFNKSKKEDMKMVVKNIPMYIRILFIFCINVLMGAAILIDIGIIDYSNKFLIMTSAIWGGWLWFLLVLYELRRNRAKVANCYDVKDDVRLIAWLLLGLMLIFINLLPVP